MTDHRAKAEAALDAVGDEAERDYDGAVLLALIAIGHYLGALLALSEPKIERTWSEAFDARYDQRCETTDNGRRCLHYAGHGDDHRYPEHRKDQP